MSLQKNTITYILGVSITVLGLALLTLFAIPQDTISERGILPDPTFAQVTVETIQDDLASYRFATQQVEEVAATDEVVPAEKTVTEATTSEEVLAEAPESTPLQTPEFVQIISADGAFQKYTAPYFANTRAWENRYGQLYAEDDVLFLGADDGTSSFAHLNAKGDWTNYQVDAVIDWHRASSFSLVVRYEDNKNYAYCGYSTNASRVTLYQVIDGTRKNLGKSPRVSVPYFEPWQNIPLSASVDGDTITCSIRDKELLRFSLSTMPSEGSAGIKTWAKDTNYSLIGLKSLSVTPL